MRKKSAVEKTTSDYERYEKNRRRRLLKEKNRRAPSAPPPELRIPVTTAEASTSHAKILKCKVCHQDIPPPYQIYVCQNNHLHTERVGGHQPHIKVSKPNDLPSRLTQYLTNVKNTELIYFSSQEHSCNHDPIVFSIARPVLDLQCAR